MLLHIQLRHPHEDEVGATVKMKVLGVVGIIANLVECVIGKSKQSMCSKVLVSKVIKEATSVFSSSRN